MILYRPLQLVFFRYDSKYNTLHTTNAPDMRGAAMLCHGIGLEVICHLGMEFLPSQE